MLETAVLSLVLLSSDAQPLSFKELFEASPRELKPSQKLLALQGRRVKMVGYMAQMEMPPAGAFYLASQPVVCGEGGGGTADLPPDAVRVVIRSAKGKHLEHSPRLLEVTGILELGNRVEEDGQVSSIRLILDQLKDRQFLKKARQPKRKANNGAMASKRTFYIQPQY